MESCRPFSLGDICNPDGHEAARHAQAAQCAGRDRRHQLRQQAQRQPLKFLLCQPQCLPVCSMGPMGLVGVLGSNNVQCRWA